VTAAVYLYFVTARIIGISHWTCRNRIGWFPDSPQAEAESV
jgi:hypothetical protein